MEPNATIADYTGTLHANCKENYTAQETQKNYNKSIRKYKTVKGVRTMSTIYPEIKSILDKCGVSADHVASITIKPMSVTIKRYALKDGKPYSEDNNVAMEPDLVIAICTQPKMKNG